jgi:hypothetical protein
VWADPIFALDPNVLPASVAWLGLIAYAVQIYFDFSGYSDMAIGLGRMLGFRFLENFNFPYTAASIREFWQRWHISLSTWFRDYLYIPLGGNRNGPLRTYFNLFAVFFLTGLWHGASWNFVVWGFVHGLFIVVERLGFGKVLNGLPRAVGMMYTLLVVVLAWVFFRCTDATHALHYLVALWSSGHGDPSLYYTSHYLPNDVRLALVLGVTGGLGWWSTLRSHSQKILSNIRCPHGFRNYRCYSCSCSAQWHWRPVPITLSFISVSELMKGSSIWRTLLALLVAWLVAYTVWTNQRKRNGSANCVLPLKWSPPSNWNVISSSRGKAGSANGI